MNGNIKGKICAVIRIMFIGALGVLFQTAQAEDITGLKYLYYNDFSKQFQEYTIQIGYDGEHDLIKVYPARTVGWSLIYFDQKGLSKLISAIDKYNVWEKKAIAKGVRLDKTISRFKPSVKSEEIYPFTPYYYEIDNTDGWHTLQSGKNKFALTTQFFSQNKKRHQFIISFPSLSEFYNIPTMYFDHSQINALKNAILPESVKKLRDEYIKKKELDSEFK